MATQLSPAEAAIARKELAAHIKQSGLTIPQIAKQSGLTEEETQNAINVKQTASTAEHVWKVHNTVHKTLKDAGKVAQVATVMTEANKLTHLGKK
ncbi:MAG: DUF2316 family protein [Gordonia sp. (in: high G+C Gram-positive bacteria)]|uniref:DUF2316 family protein n=1 Tax=Gordonia sp. (in: high G+C Gram-positive bacteria) TaxID=84139 RepID=UPI0039E2558A